ncbi:DsbA family oxidoreductase [Kordiimonas gwangyangensis]|nr:DsbA family protein [Kordiimonas gwangyangensis]
MKAYFEDCEFLGDRELLASIAGRVGMDENLVRELLATDRDKAETQNDIMQVQRMGVSGVPLYILDQRVGLSGAQGEATIADAIDRVSAGE